MKEAKEVNWAELREFAEALGTKGFKSDRDITRLSLCLDLVVLTIHIDRNSKGGFKQISGSIIPSGYNLAYQVKLCTQLLEDVGYFA